ncbi:MAG TPA: LPS export ABC transporter periplasmic protein LptC [Chitinophagaceae bacterium]|nr:LPS export ABC transporter periplasmic protein LptC [Chitinophagaceae bacterium]
MIRPFTIKADRLVRPRFFLLTQLIATIEPLLRRTLVRSYRFSALLVPRSFVLLVMMSLSFVVLFSSCENDPKVIKELTEKVYLKEEARTVESYLSQGGMIKAKLVAPLMYRHQRDTIMTEFPNTLQVDFYADSLKIESWLFAKYGIYYDNLNKVFLRDSVIVINIEGDTLRTPELWWDQNSGKFYTDKPARLDGKDKHITGNQGLEATQDLKIIQFKYPTGPFNVKEGSMPQ